MKWLDPYEIRARITPAVIVGLPIAFSLCCVVYNLSDSVLKLLSSGVVLLGLIYALSFLVRHYGLKIEPKLWKSWGGPSSTRFLRWCDSTFGEDLKRQLHEAVGRRCHIKLLSKEEESADAAEADEKISQAFTQVKSIVRREDPEGLWYKHNAEYGFNRNLLGSRWVWLFLSILGAITCGLIWWYKRDNVLIIGFIFNILWITISLAGGWYFLPKFVKEAADRYGESEWNSFLTIASNRN